MNKYKKIEEEFYKSKYGMYRKGNSEELWDKIKNNKELLRWAIKPIKDKFDKKDVVNGITICEAILSNYENIDIEIYNELVDLVYSNPSVARIVLDGYSNGGFSYLLMVLWNHNIKLSNDQKKFAVNEAMNKIGTVRYPLNNNFETQSHGIGEFDIRYYILRNPNWSIEEKQQLVYEFYAYDDDYEKTLEQWELCVANDYSNYEENTFGGFDKSLMYDYSYDDLLNFYGDRNTTNRIWDEIKFCRLMHQLRPYQWELEYKRPRILKQ